MILSQTQILQRYNKGDIIYHSPAGYKIEDFAKNQSVDVHLGDWLYFPENKQWTQIPPEGLIIPKNTFFLAHTEEYIGTQSGSNLHPQWHLRSTLARLGLGHSKAGWGDTGFFNRWCMEFYTYLEFNIQRGQRVAQISFSETSASDSDYTKQTGNYQSSDNLDLLFANWRKEQILPKNNNL